MIASNEAEKSYAPGFTTGTPWIAGHLTEGVHVAAQEGDPESVLEWHRELIALRRGSDALVYGPTEVERTSRKVWRYRRRFGDEEFVVVLNLTDAPVRAPRPPAGELVLCSGDGGRILAPYEAQIWRSHSVVE